MLSVDSQERLKRLGLTVFERGWLSSNNVLFDSEDSPTALVDSGYGSHQQQTLHLVKESLAGRALDLLVNTHLHSDHCGGNAALQAEFPDLTTLIPPGHAAAVADWDEKVLSYAATGQVCPPFGFDGKLEPGTPILLGSNPWTVLSAEGHDPHALVFFQPEERVLISADALWQNGFGVVFPELDGVDAFEEVATTLDLIEELEPTVVIPGHGPVFEDTADALMRARTRLDQFRRNPQRHLRHAHKVLIKFRLLEWQSIRRPDLLAWVLETPYFQQALACQGNISPNIWLDDLLIELQRSRALVIDGDHILNI